MFLGKAIRKFCICTNAFSDSSGNTIYKGKKVTYVVLSAY